MNQRKKQKNKNPIIGGRKFKDKNIMTNDKLKQIIFILVVTIVILFTTLAIILTNHRTRKQPVPPQKIIIVADTISKVVFDTVYIDRFVTKKLQLTDTLIIDSVRIDSIFVEVPISTYKLDTVFQTDSTQLNLFIQNSGYEVTLDTLYYQLQYTPTPIKLPKKRHRFGFFVGPAVGLGYDYLNNKPVPTVGIGVGIGWTMKKY